MGGRQESRRRYRDALALDRLDDEPGDVAALEFSFERGQVAERDRGARQHRAEAVAKVGGAVHRQGTRGQPVKRVVAVDDAVAAGRVARELQRRFDRLGAAVAEVDAVEVRRLRQHHLGQRPGQRGGVELGEVGQLRRRARRATPGGRRDGAGPARIRRSPRACRGSRGRRRRRGTRRRRGRRCLSNPMACSMRGSCGLRSWRCRA